MKKATAMQAGEVYGTISGGFHYMPAGEYEYIADPYPQVKYQSMQHKEGDAAREPFRPTVSNRRSHLFSMFKYEDRGLAAAERHSEHSRPAFKPSSAGRTSGFSRWPEHMACPVQAPQRRIALQKDLLVWRAAGGSKTALTRSIVIMNLR
ncbi:g3475 [Coccomyxa elongata]